MCDRLNIIMKALNGFLMSERRDLERHVSVLCNVRKLHRPRTCILDTHFGPFLADSVSADTT